MPPSLPLTGIGRSNDDSLAVFVGEVPFRIVVCGDGKGKWFWPKERRNICDAYTFFGLWGANRDVATEWYGAYIDDYVVKW